MKLLFKSEISISGYGFVLNQYTALSLESISQRRETCLLLIKNSFDLLYQDMENILFIPDGATWYDEACNVLRVKHYLHSSIEKSLMERVNQYFKDRIESFDTITHVCRKANVIYFMYITGYNSLFPCILIQNLKIISLMN